MSPKRLEITPAYDAQFRGGGSIAAESVRGSQFWISQGKVTAVIHVH